MKWKWKVVYMDARNGILGTARGLEPDGSREVHRDFNEELTCSHLGQVADKIMIELEKVRD